MKRKVVIVLEDSEEGFSRQMYVEPPLPADIAEAQPTPALLCAMVVHRAIQAFVETGEQEAEKPLEEGKSMEGKPMEVKPDDQN
jgi:hypothetical protein